MTKTAEFMWSSMLDFYDKNKELYPGLIFDDNKKSAFIKSFKKKYDNIKNHFMAANVDNLDRHKQAALLIDCAIENKIFVCDEVPKGKIFVGLYQFSLLMGLSYMKQRLNESLENFGFEKVEIFDFPEAITSNATYFDMLTRELLLQDTNNKETYILFLANILFLIEYRTLEKNNIDISKYKKEYQKKMKEKKNLIEHYS